MTCGTVYFKIRKGNYTMVNTRVLTGLMELIPEQQIAFDKMKRIIEDEYVAFGYTPIDTPVIERAEVLLAKAGGETEKQVYRFEKGDNDLALRFDLTVPLARYVADHYNDLTFPFRRSHIAKVYRGERPQKGRYREFYQCDIDVIGKDTLDVAYDAELPRVIYSIFKKLDVGKFTIRVNNRKVLKGFMRALGVEGQSSEILGILDKVDKLPKEEFLKLLNGLGLGSETVDKIVEFSALRGDAVTVIDSLVRLGITDEEFVTGLGELSEVTSLMAAMGIDSTYFAIDLSIVRGLDYYTGTIYETTLDDYRQLGSICSGGRYEDLASHYTSFSLPGVGISIGLTRLFSQLLENGLIKTDKKTIADLVILPIAKEQLPEALSLADALRAGGLSIETYLNDAKFKTKMKYADKSGATFAIIIGEDEAATKSYTYQNMTTGEKERLSIEELLARYA